MESRQTIRFLRPVALSLLAVAGVLGQSGSSNGGMEENSRIFLVEIPEAGIAAATNPLIYLSSGDISEVVINVNRPEADDIEYGDIFPAVNGAAAAVISETRPSETGKKVHVQLHRRPGFRLLPGFNTVGVRARDTQGREFHATFVVHIPKGACEGTKAKLLTVDDLGELLRVGVSNIRLTQLVLDCGVNFQPSLVIEERLRAQGAQETLLRTIEDPLKAEQQGLGSKGMNIEELLNLMEEHTPSEELLELVRSRGVNFPLNAATDARLRQAGASETLLQAIRMRSKEV